MTVRLEGIDLVVFDKDGTLIDFGPMWSGWAEALAASLDGLTGRRLTAALYEMLGYDPARRNVRPGGGLAATPMARLRERTAAVLVRVGLSEDDAEAALARAWHAPDPVELAHPLTDLAALLDRLRSDGKRLAIATTDDRQPTERTLAALGLADVFDVVACADDGIAIKPAPDMVLAACEATGVQPARTAVVGDSPADLAMGRAAGAGLVVGVLTGVGGQADLAPQADVLIDSVADLLPG